MGRRRRSKRGKSWIAKTMKARPTRKEQVYAERVIERKKKRKVRIVTRRTQPSVMRGETGFISLPSGKTVEFLVRDVSRLKKEIGMGGPVSSSWIAALYWQGKWVRMELINGYSYSVYIPFKVFEEWYYAHSKGTYFNYFIKDKFKVVRSA